MTVDIRIATPDDFGALETLIERSSRVLLVPFLSPAQLAASLEVMTLDREPIADGTYFVAEEGGIAVGCGSWTRRGGFVTAQHGRDGDSVLLAPGREPARVRAMYTDPEHARRGIGCLVLETCENAARGPDLPKGNSWRYWQASRSIWPPDGGKPSGPSFRRVRESMCLPCAE